MIRQLLKEEVDERILQHMRKRFIGKVFTTPYDDVYIILDITYDYLYGYDEPLYILHWRYSNSPVVDYMGDAANKIQTIYGVNCGYKMVKGNVDTIQGD